MCSRSTPRSPEQEADALFSSRLDAEAERLATEREHPRLASSVQLVVDDCAIPSHRNPARDRAWYEMVVGNFLRRSDILMIGELEIRILAPDPALEQPLIRIDVAWNDTVPAT